MEWMKSRTASLAETGVCLSFLNQIIYSPSIHTSILALDILPRQSQKLPLNRLNESIGQIVLGRAASE